MKNQIGCNVDWKKMVSLLKSENKYCNVCAQEIHDITGKSKKEIEKLRKKSNGKFCVKANIEQVYFQNKKMKVNNSIFVKLGIVGLLLIGGTDMSSLYAQNHDSKKLYKIRLVDTISDEVKISGIVQRKKKFGIKVGLMVGIKIYNQEGLIVKRLDTNDKGKFDIRIPKKVLGEKYSILAEIQEFQSVRIDDVNVEDTDVKIMMKKSSFHYIGFF